MNATNKRPSHLADAADLFDGTAPLKAMYGLDDEPGAEQRALIAHTLKGLQTSAREFYFPGAAGTGKTTTLKVLLAVLKDCGKNATVAAPTHKAAGRASEALAGAPVLVIHAIVYAGAEEEIEYQKDAKGNYLLDEKGEKIPMEFSDELLFNRREDGTAKVGEILVIDEASMVGMKLATDLWNALPGITKVVAVGDPHQLPPVMDEAGFDLSKAEIELTKVYRQEDASSVLKAATKIREEGVPFTYSRCGADWKRGDTILRQSGVESNWWDAAEAARELAAMYRRNEGDAAAIVGVHTSRTLLNDGCRHFLGFPQRVQGPQVGERLICRAGGAGLRNADIVEVTQVETEDFGGEFGLGWVLRVKTETGYEKEIAVLKLTWNNQPNMRGWKPSNRGMIPRSIRNEMDFYCDEDRWTYGNEIAGIVDDKATAWEKKKGEAPSWLLDIWEAQAAREVGAMALYLKKYMASVDSGYAITCHAAQGSQYEEILVVADSVDFIAEDEADQVYRWSYTALTRAVSNAIVVKKSRGGWDR